MVKNGNQIKKRQVTGIIRITGIGNGYLSDSSGSDIEIPHEHLHMWMATYLDKRLFIFSNERMDAN